MTQSSSFLKNILPEVRETHASFQDIWKVPAHSEKINHIDDPKFISENMAKDNILSNVNALENLCEEFDRNKDFYLNEFKVDKYSLLAVKEQLESYSRYATSNEFKDYLSLGGIQCHGDTDASKPAALTALLLSGKWKLNESNKKEYMGMLLLSAQAFRLDEGESRNASLKGVNENLTRFLDKTEFYSNDLHRLLFVGDMSRDRLSGEVRCKEGRDPVSTDHGFMKVISKYADILGGNHDTSSNLARHGGAQSGYPKKGVDNNPGGSSINHQEVKEKEDVIKDIREFLKVSYVEKNKDKSNLYISHTGAVIIEGDIYIGLAYEGSDVKDDIKGINKSLKENLGVTDQTENIVKFKRTSWDGYAIVVDLNSLKKICEERPGIEISVLNRINNLLIKNNNISIATNYPRLDYKDGGLYDSEGIENFNKFFNAKQIHGHDDGHEEGFTSINRGFTTEYTGQDFKMHAIPNIAAKEMAPNVNYIKKRNTPEAFEKEKINREKFDRKRK